MFWTYNLVTVTHPPNRQKINTHHTTLDGRSVQKLRFYSPLINHMRTAQCLSLFHRDVCIFHVFLCILRHSYVTHDKYHLHRNTDCRLFFSQSYVVDSREPLSKRSNNSKKKRVTYGHVDWWYMSDRATTFILNSLKKKDKCFCVICKQNMWANKYHRIREIRVQK